MKEFACNDNFIFPFMGKRFHRSRQHGAVQIDGLGFFCKYNRTFKILCYNGSNSDSGCFDGKNLINLHAFKSAFEFFSHLIKQLNIHLVI